MRKILTILTALAVTVLADAQKHIDYEGLQICGDISSFSDELGKMGFEFMNKTEDNYYFTGRDPDLGEVMMVVGCLPEKDGRDVYAIMMTSKALMSFVTAESIYKRTQRELDRMYGEGYYDEWIDDDLDTDDLNRMRAIATGKGRYYSEYKRPNGTTMISMMSREGILYVVKSFVDKTGGGIMEKNLTQ